ncbi:hypothetical protein INR49_025303 [Caranx melampygus]|nr:hypothetical protein INR49_025303 [Caranx melampygus]
MRPCACTTSSHITPYRVQLSAEFVQLIIDVIHLSTEALVLPEVGIKLSLILMTLNIRRYLWIHAGGGGGGGGGRARRKDDITDADRKRSLRPPPVSSEGLELVLPPWETSSGRLVVLSEYLQDSSIKNYKKSLVLFPTIIINIAAVGPGAEWVRVMDLLRQGKEGKRHMEAEWCLLMRWGGMKGKLERIKVGRGGAKVKAARHGNSVAMESETTDNGFRTSDSLRTSALSRLWVRGDEAAAQQPHRRDSAAREAKFTQFTSLEQRHSCCQRDVLLAQVAYDGWVHAVLSLEVKEHPGHSVDANQRSTDPVRYLTNQQQHTCIGALESEHGVEVNQQVCEPHRGAQVVEEMSHCVTYPLED